MTAGPGLVGALLVGMAGAKAVSLATGADLVGVNHLEGHYWANFLEHGRPNPPYVALIVSGGHTMLVHMPEMFHHVVMGQTLDDAAGEAFDKVARLIGLGFPGGPALDAMARQGDPHAIRFPRAMEDSGDFDFSMSGLKTAVLRHVKSAQAAGQDLHLPDLAASFQEAIVDVQVTKTIAAAKAVRAPTVLLGGGVVANTRLRERMAAAGEQEGLGVLFPSMPLCTDNAAMIACLGAARWARGERTVARHRRRSATKVECVSTVLVTGGAGFIGSHLADRLLAEGHRVISVDDLTTGRIANLVDARGYGKEFTFFNMDVRADGLRPLFERHRPEIVFHLAAQSGVRPSLEDPVLDASINVMGTLNVLECAARFGRARSSTRRAVARSTANLGAFRPRNRAPRARIHSSPYGISKKVVLDYLGFYQRYRGLDFTALALGNVYGPRQDPNGEAGVIAIFASRMLAGEPITIFGDGNQTRDYVFIDDVVHAFVQAIDRGPGKVVNIGTGLEASVNHVFRLLADIIGYGAEPAFGPLPPGELRRIALDIASASNAIAWKPWTHLEDGLAETVAYLKGV